MPCCAEVPPRHNNICAAAVPWFHRTEGITFPIGGPDTVGEEAPNEFLGEPTTDDMLLREAVCVLMGCATFAVAIEDLTTSLDLPHYDDWVGEIDTTTCGKCRQAFNHVAAKVPVEDEEGTQVCQPVRLLPCHSKIWYILTSVVWCVQELKWCCGRCTTVAPGMQDAVRMFPRATISKLIASLKEHKEAGRHWPPVHMVQYLCHMVRQQCLCCWCLKFTFLQYTNKHNFDVGSCTSPAAD